MYTILRPRRTQRYKNIKRVIIYSCFGICLLLTMAYKTYQTYHTYDHNNNNLNSNMHSRKLLAERYKLGSYPTDLLTKPQLESGGLILHILGVLYCFLAIAIVCDEFFVPAIEVIVDRLNMSPDTAGATFMAAGGSAPELFTSFIGTFISKDDVGFGTIVGSAVFNVLFVIGCCAMFSSGDLVLTWYPFARDCIYYSISLIVLAGFFSDKTIYWWEALILLFLYVGYVTLMMNNVKVYSWIATHFLKIGEKEKEEQIAEQTRVAQGLSFNVSLFKLLTADATVADIAGIHMVARMKGDVKATFKQVDTNGDGHIDKEEFSAVLRRLGGGITDEEVDACYKELDQNEDGIIDFSEFQRWYLRSENRMNTDVNQIFNKFDADHDGFIRIDELKNLVIACQGLDEDPSDEELEEARKLLDANNDKRIDRNEFLNWYKSSIFFEKAKKRRDTIVEIEEEEEGVSLKFPENTVGRINYIITAPIMFSLVITCPDVRKKKWANWYPAAFISSIAWLAVYSYLMVWWASVFGEIVGIPPGVMGLTLLAAGTSVPDLLTSIIVARDGHGDMAVSSSIGSNIFDILMGLPLPWFFYCVSLGDGKIKVAADSLFVSILVLFIMLACIIIIIKWQKWRMTRSLGYCMFVLYFLFVAQDLMNQYGVFK